jgi:uncharacterized protein
MSPMLQERIQVIDVLRGFALLGIALVHFTEQYYAGVPPKTHEMFAQHNVADSIVNAVIGIFISGKFFMIFSFLFGLSFFIQLNKSDGSAAFLFRFAWRLILLFAIGMVHHLHYRGDILTIYAVLGAGLLLAYKLPDKILLVVALLLVFDLPAFVSRFYQAVAVPTTENPFGNFDQKTLELYYDTLKNGSYKEILVANFFELKEKFVFQVESGRLYITLGLFLLGLYAGRKRIFEQPLRFKKLIRFGLWLLLGCVLAAAVFAGVVFGAKLEVGQMMQFAIGGLVYDAFNAALASIYVGLIVTSFEKERWKKRWMIFYEVGRMGLTTYLTQALIGTTLLFSFGFAPLGEYGAAPWAVVAFIVFATQIAVSKWWFGRFQFGPVEWLWRSLTFFKLQPLRKTNL